MNSKPELDISRQTHLFLLTLIGVVVAFFVWSMIGRLDVVSFAVGNVVPSSQVKTVQHLEGGIVAAIMVREGDRVTVGQPLVAMESISSGADVEELKVRMVSLTADVARLEAEVTGGDIVFSEGFVDGNPDLARQTRALFDSRRVQFENDMASQTALMNQRLRESDEIRARLANTRQKLTFLREQVAISVELLKDELTNRMLHLNYLKERADLRGRIDEAKATLPRLKAAAEEARSNLHIVQASFREEAQQKLDEASRSYDELSQRQKKYEDSLQRTVLRAPVDGTVKTVYVSTKGGVVQPGRTVLDIVPGGDRLVIEAQLPTQDIGYVQPGQAVKVKLASADAARFRDLVGEVVTVSPDTLVTEQGVPYYKVRITTKRDYFEDGTLRYSLFPGMQVICAIQTGSRTIFQYIMEPLIGRMGDALKER